MIVTIVRIQYRTGNGNGDSGSRRSARRGHVAASFADSVQETMKSLIGRKHCQNIRTIQYPCLIGYPLLYFGNCPFYVLPLKVLARLEPLKKSPSLPPQCTAGPAGHVDQQQKTIKLHSHLLHVRQIRYCAIDPQEHFRLLPSPREA